MGHRDLHRRQAQNELDDQFEQAAVAVPPTVTDVPTSTTSVAPATTSTSPPTPIGASTTVAPTTPATTAVPTTTGPQTVPFPFAAPETGDVLVRLQIPSIGVDHKVVQGVGLDQLKRGPGHFPESVLPGQLGNTAIAGHRTTYGAPFSDVDKLRPGDTIVLTYPDVGGQRGPQFTYVVTKPTSSRPPTTPMWCRRPIRRRRRSCCRRAIPSAPPPSGWTSLRGRSLDPTQSSPLFAATPTSPAVGAPVLPGDGTGDDATTVAAPAPTDATPTPSTGVADTVPAAAAPTLAPTSASTPATTIAAAPPAASEDAFAGGWFDDSAAWPQIIVWGLLLAAITIGGYVLARRQRRIWLGVLVSFVPFVVVLYFWFENVNRLLPPGI